MFDKNMRPINDLYILTGGFIIGSLLFFPTGYFLTFVVATLPALLVTAGGLMQLGTECTRDCFDKSLWAKARFFSVGLGVLGSAIIAKLL